MGRANAEILAQIRDSVGRFANTELKPNIAAYEDRREFPYALIEKMGEAGLFGAAFPEDLGGTDIGFGAVSAISDELGYHMPEFSYAMNLQAMTCPYTIYNWGTDDQAKRFVPDLIAGKKIGMFALTEPGGGSDAAGNMKTTARRDGDHYILNGSKMWITFSHACDAGVILAKTDPGAGVRGITAFIIEPKTQSGYHADPIPLAGLTKALSSCAVSLDDVRIPVENRLGEEGEGFKIAMNALEYGRLTVSSRCLGLARAAFDEAKKYAKDRIVRGQPVATYQMSQALFADMAVKIEASKLMVAKLADTMDANEAANRIAAQAKFFASETAKFCVQAASEMFGGYALAEEYPMAKIAANVNMLNMGEGAPAVQRILIAEDALGYKDANRHPVRNKSAARWMQEMRQVAE